MCFGLGSRGILVPLGPKSLTLAAYVRILYIAIFIYALCELIAFDFVRGVIDLLVVLIGWLAVKKPTNNAIDYTRLMCLMIFSVIRLIMSIIFSAIWFASTNHATSYASYILIGVFALGPPLWAISVALHGSLYYELKRTLNESMDGLDGGESGMGGGGLGFGGMFGGQQQQVDPSTNQSAPAAGSGGYSAPLLRTPAAEAPSGFRAFAGQGHRLS